MWEKVAAAEKNKEMLDLTTIPGMQTADRYLKVINICFVSRNNYCQKVIGTRLRGNDYTKLKFRREMFAMILRCDFCFEL